VIHAPKPERHIYYRDEKVSAGKLHAMQYVVVLMLALLATGMWKLQILSVGDYRLLAEANRVRKDPVRAPRGRIFDREGRIIVDNYPSITCYLLRGQGRDIEPDIPMIARALDLPVDQIQTTRTSRFP
jgi:penicillin-binding protein 2